MKIIICTIKSWNINEALKLKEKYKDYCTIKVISKKEDLNYEDIQHFNPDYIFFPHWSYLIPESIFTDFECVVFHMTDLPFGRGGSPLQNLISRGIKETKISSLSVQKELDAGPIYLKENLNLCGTAEEIFIRASKIIFNKMITYIIENKPIPQEQQGEVVEFKRRRPEDGKLLPTMSLEEMYDYIRMLDGEGYPPAFMKFGNYKLNFSRASLKNGKIVADVEITEEDEHE